MKAKRLFALLLCCIFSLSLAVPSFADNDDNGIVPYNEYGDSISSVGNTAYQLNAYTEGMPESNTRVTVWSNTGSNTQRWSAESTGTYANDGRPLFWFRNAANYNVVLSYNDEAQVRLATKSSASITRQGILFIDEGINNGYYQYGLALPTYLLAITATGYYNGAPAQWQSSNGLNNQLWFFQLYY